MSSLEGLDEVLADSRRISAAADEALDEIAALMGSTQIVPSGRSPASWRPEPSDVTNETIVFSSEYSKKLSAAVVAIATATIVKGKVTRSDLASGSELKELLAQEIPLHVRGPAVVEAWKFAVWKQAMAHAGEKKRADEALKEKGERTVGFGLSSLLGNAESILRSDIAAHRGYVRLGDEPPAKGRLRLVR